MSPWTCLAHTELDAWSEKNFYILPSGYAGRKCLLWNFPTKRLSQSRASSQQGRAWTSSLRVLPSMAFPSSSSSKRNVCSSCSDCCFSVSIFCLWASLRDCSSMWCCWRRRSSSSYTNTHMTQALIVTSVKNEVYQKQNLLSNQKWELDSDGFCPAISIKADRSLGMISEYVPVRKYMKINNHLHILVTYCGFEIAVLHRL